MVSGKREVEYANLVEYCKARRKGFEGLLDYTQPLMEVSQAAVAGNHLNPSFRPFTEPAKAAVKCMRDSTLTASGC